MGSRLVVATAMVLTGGLLMPPAGSAGSEPSDRTRCTFTTPIALLPGLSVVPTSGTFSSGGENGRVSCDGPVRGIVPTGEGTLGVEGRYGTDDPDTCFGGEGEGRFSFTFPTATGVGRRSNVFTFSFSLFGLSTGGSSGNGFSGDGFGGGFDEVRPEEGDCVLRPVTKLIIKGHGTITRQ
jgi:hypothetical protein